MKLFKTTMALCAVAILAACQATSGKTARDIAGVNLGKGKIQTIQAHESRMNLMGDQSLITGRKAVELPGRRMEEWRIKGGGWIKYEELHDNYFNPNVDAHDQLFGLARQIKKPGFALHEQDIKWMLFQGDKLYYAYRENEHGACVGFASFFGNLNGYANKNLRGGICQFPDKGTFKPDMKTAVLDMMRRMKFN